MVAYLKPSLIVLQGGFMSEWVEHLQNLVRLKIRPFFSGSGARVDLKTGSGRHVSGSKSPGQVGFGRARSFWSGPVGFGRARVEFALISTVCSVCSLRGSLYIVSVLFVYLQCARSGR